MKKIIFSVFFLITISAKILAQPAYHQAIGLKFPGGLLVTYKKFIAETNNIEAQFTSWNKGFRVSGLYEFNFYTFAKVDGLSWFVGPGVHIGFWKDAYKNDFNSKTDLGLDGIIGLDYKVKNAPINLSLDWEPSITLIGNAGFMPAYGGIAVRFTF